MKATYVEKEGVGEAIFKDPVTDDGTKKSLTGLIQVTTDEKGDIIAKDNCNWVEEQQELLQNIYIDGDFYNVTTLSEIRSKLNNHEKN